MARTPLGATFTGANLRSLVNGLEASAPVSVLDFGAAGDGTTDDTAAGQAAFDAARAAGAVLVFPPGDYLTGGWDATGVRVAGGAGVRLLANGNGVTLLSFANSFKTSASMIEAYANGFSGVTGFCLNNFRHASALNMCRATDCEIGFHFEQLCWNTGGEFCYATGGSYGYVITDGSNGLTLLHCASDGCAAAGATITQGATYPTYGVNIIGGFHQNTARGVDDDGRGTKIIGPAFETCSEADIYLQGRFPHVEGTIHTATTGTVCIKGRGCEAATILYPVLEGTRSTGLFDFDATNTYCKARKNETAGTNTVLGTTTGLAVETRAVRVNEAGEVGINGAAVTGYPFAITLPGGGDLRAADYGASSAFGTWQASKAMRWNAPGSHRFFSGTAGLETEQMRVESGIVTLFGQLQAASLPTYADNAAATAGGIPAGRLYKTATGEIRVRV